MCVVFRWCRDLLFYTKIPESSIDDGVICEG